MTAIEEVKARIDIVDLVSETVQLRRSGKSYTGFCPFHSNTRTPAFVIFPESGTWRCFGQCNEGGDIFKFVMKKEGWDFTEALRFLADKAGVQLKPPDPHEQALAEEHAHLRSLLDEAVIFYRHQLLNTPAGGAALEYLRRRGLRDETLEAFGLGYAPQAWEAALNYFKSKGYPEKDLLEAGLLVEKEAEGAAPARLFDRFRHRIMIPIRDERGRMAGFGARILDPNDKGAKFINSPQSPLFDKGRLLYGLDRARKEIHKQDQAVIVEGYLDVIALHQAGFENVVSPMGTALTESQLNLLKRFTRRIILALDPDAAGKGATLRGLQLARQALDREAEPVYDARGLLGYEARIQGDIRITTLPEGLDPDDIVNRDKGEWERILAEAKPVVAYVMDTLAASGDLEDPKYKDELAAQVLPLIEDLPSPIERDSYRQRLARLLKVDESVLYGLLGAQTGSRRPSRRGAGPIGERVPQREARSRPAQLSINGVESTYSLEAHILSVLFRRPDLVYKMDRRLQEEGLNRLLPEDFQNTHHQTILRLLRESIDQDWAEPAHEVQNKLPLDLWELADEILSRSTSLDPSEERVLADIMRALIKLRSRTVHEIIDYQRFMMQDAQEQGDLKATQLQQSVVQHTLLILRLERAHERYSARA
jgi:DNA primase